MGMKMNKGLVLALILLTSSFWPFAYAQPASNVGPNFCSLGKLGVVDLDYDQVTAIQGIITQDVLSSAEMYKSLKASRELGLNQSSKAGQIAQRYRLYFVGPDGQVKYSDIVNQRLTSAKEWVLNTTIFGRVEYAGTLGEDLLVCPDLPTNEKGMCNYKAGDQVQDVYSKDWTVGVGTPGEAAGQAYFNMVSGFVQAAQNSGNPFGEVNIGMSRIRSHKYIVSVAAPAGSQLFIIPKTYMYFMSNLKNLAEMEAVAQGAFFLGGIATMFKNFKAGRTFLENKERAVETPYSKFKSLISRFSRASKGKGSMKDAREGFEAWGKLQKGVINDLADNIEDTDLEEIWRTIEYTKVYKPGKEVELGKLVISPTEQKKLIFSIAQGDADDIAELLMEKGVPSGTANSLAKSLVSQHSDDFIKSISQASSKIPKIGGNAKKVKKIFEKYKKAKSNLKEIDAIEEQVKAGKITEKEAMKLIQQLDFGEASSDLYAWERALSKQERWKTLWADYRNFEEEGYLQAYRDILFQEAPKNPFARIFIRGPVVPHKMWPALMKAGAAKAAYNFFISGWVKSLLYVGRPITAMAWGLQLFSEIFMMKGYLEISPPGITLEWDKNTTGDLFTKQGYILVKGTPTSVSGMYSAGELGSLGAQQLAEFLLSLGIDPMVAGKFSELGDYMIFGYDFNDNAYNKILKVETGKPSGITRITRARNGYLLRMANWNQEGISILEDPTTMKPVGNESLLTSVAVTTSGADIYAYIYGNPDQVKSQFPITWTFASKLGDFGFLSNAVIAGTLIYFWPTVPRAIPAIGAPMITGISKSVSTGAKQLVVAKATDMKSLEECVKTGKCKRRPCEKVCAECEAELGSMSAYLITSGMTQMVIDWTPGLQEALAPVSLGLGIADMVILEGGIPTPGGGIKLFEGKMEKTQRCINELLTCDERNFIIVAGQTIKNPSVLKAEQEQAMKLKGLPGLDQIPVEKLLGPITNLTSPINLDQEQLNVHGEFYNATGRVALRNIYYLHIMDATIDFLASSLPFHMCGLTDNETVEQCVDIQGDTLKYGNVTVKSPLVPFKWIDTDLPAMVIPNTAVYLNISSSPCAVFSVSPENLQPSFNPDLVSKFQSLNFTELSRTFGNLRVINLDEGSIYPVTNVDGKLRLELDLNDGSYQETEKPVWLESNGKLVFTNLKNETRELTFRSAVFTGGTIVKKGNAIYILPRYFRPSISGIEWRKLVGTKPFASLNGQPPIATDSQGNILGIDARNTKIPGADKLGIITAVSGYKDLNGDGKIQDNEKVGWRFYKVGNKTYFDLFYKGKKETYEGSQVEVEPDGTVKVYERGKPHTDAYLLRQISTRVDELGRTLMTIKDGKGNDLVKDALLTWIKGTGGSIQYNPDTNNYVFVNGQPIELNNEFKTNGFNAVTGIPDPPLLQPSAVHGTKPWEQAKKKTTVPAVVPTVPESDLAWYVLIIILGLAGVYLSRRARKKGGSDGLSHIREGK